MLELKVGDVVRLKSGGPKMVISPWTQPETIGVGTVGSGPTEGTVFCCWFEPVFPEAEDVGTHGKDECWGHSHAAEFSPMALELAE